MDNLDTFTLAKLNIFRKPFRSASLAFLTFALAFTLFTGSFLVKSLKEGLASLSNRLGAASRIIFILNAPLLMSCGTLTV